MVVTINKKQFRTNTEWAVVPASGVIVSTPFHCVNYVARPTDVRATIQQYVATMRHKNLDV